MYKRLYSYLQANDILYQHQFGLIKNRSTVLIEAVGSIYKHLDNHKSLIGI